MLPFLIFLSLLFNACKPLLYHSHSSSFSEISKNTSQKQLVENRSLDKSRYMGRVPFCDNNGLKKGPWTPEEDQKLIDYIQKHGHGAWRTLPKNAGLMRCGKSCRLRWANYLRPDIKRGSFTFEEEETIIHLHSVLGNKWSAIATYLPGRTDNDIKNYWKGHIKKRLLRSGIDPVTHRPRHDLLNLYSLLSMVLINLPAQLDASKLLEIKPHMNTEFLSIAINLLQSQCQKQNLLKCDQIQESQPNYHQTILQPASSVLYNPDQFNNASQWQYSEASSCNLSENSITGNNNLCLESMGQPISNLLDEASTIEQLGDQNLYNDLDSVLSKPMSTVTLNNSSEINFFDFQIPDLLDMSEFI